jgi:micrococcal nuclease
MERFVYRAFISTVIDGDTVVADVDLGFGVILKDQRFRLIGIDAPEKRGLSRKEGLQSMQAMKDLIEDRWVVIKTVKDRKEKWGRWLAEVWVDDDNINLWMVKEGYARNVVM